jgi:hypothetical protein
MKLNPIKFGLAAGASMSVLMFVKLLFVKFVLLCAPHGMLRHKGLCAATGGGFFASLLMFIVSLLTTFLVVSLVGWLFAWTYNKLLDAF